MSPDVFVTYLPGRSRLGFMLLNYEPRALVQLIKCHDFRIGGVTAKEFERAVTVLINAVSTHKLIQATDDQERLWEVVECLLPSGIAKLVVDGELRSY